MAIMLVQHEVKDYATWKNVFDSAYKLRTSSGELGNEIYRDATDPNNITIVNTWDNLENARKFAHSPELKAAMEKGGVISKPDIQFLTKA